jgi:hypothetical protein
MKKALIAILVVLGLGFGLLLLLANLNGYIADPAFYYSYVTSSSNNKFLFVMLGPKAWPPDPKWRDENMEKSRQLQSKYATSGLYLNDGSVKPLWERSEYSWKVFVPSDGIHLAAPAPWPRTAADQALSFYENGKLIRSYRVKDLVDLPWFLPGGHQHFDWDRDIKLDDDNGRLTVTTEHYDRYVFDTATGKIISARRPTRILISIFVIAFFLLLIRWQREALKRTAKSNKGLQLTAR